MLLSRDNLDKTISRLAINTPYYTFDIQLRGHITIFEGVSSSCKTLLLNTIKYDHLNNSKELADKYQLMGVIKLDYSGYTQQMTEDEIIALLKNRSKNLILIDNADTLLSGKEKLCKFISSDIRNQYMIMSRGGLKINTNTNHISYLVSEDKRITNKFLTSIPGWK